MPGIPTTNILQPGAVSLPQANRLLISNLQLLTPQYWKNYVELYGNEDYTMWLSTFGGMEEIKNRDFFWFESRGKLMVAVTVNAQITTPAAGATVTITLATGDHYNAGTQSPLRVGETVRVASSNIEGKILSVDKTTPGAHTFTVRPLQSALAFVSAGSTSLLAQEVLVFGGDTEAGEASNSIDPLIDLDSRRANSVTEIRETWSATDLAEMAEIYYNSGVSGDAIPGGQQAGTSYFTYKGLIKSNKRFKNNIEFKLMKGDVLTNTGLTNSVGTQGLIPQIMQYGQTVTVTPGTLDIAKLHEITRAMDVNGSAKDNLWLMDIYQRQDFSDSLFNAYPAGAWVWGSNERSQEAAINYGVQSIMLDGYMFKAKKYMGFNTEVTTGKTPGVDFFRNFGVIIPQGDTEDAKDSTKRYKNVSVIYQQPVKGGTTGNGIRVWQWGGGSVNATNGQMVDSIEMITYRGIRGAALNQAIIVRGS